MSLSHYKDHYKRSNNLKDDESLSDKNNNIFACDSNNFCNLPDDIFSSIIKDKFTKKTFLIAKYAFKNKIINSETFTAAKQLIINGKHKEVLKFDEIKKIIMNLESLENITCLICYSDLNVLEEDIIKCCKNHNFCTSCFNDYVKIKLLIHCKTYQII